MVCHAKGFVGTGSVGCRVATDDKFADHARDAEHQHACHINENECRTAVLSRHIREPPDVTQSHSRPCRSKNHAYLGCKISSIRLYHHTLFYCVCEFVDDSQLVQEYRQDKYRADDSHTEQIDAEEPSAECAPVGELVFHDFLWHIPSNEEAGEEAADRQQYLSGHEIEYVEKRFAGYLQIIHVAQRERAEDADDASGDAHDEGAHLTADVQFLEEERRAHFMQGDERCEGGKCSNA